LSRESRQRGEGEKESRDERETKGFSSIIHGSFYFELSSGRPKWADPGKYLQRTRKKADLTAAVVSWAGTIELL
jgi:hypothetical protein